MLQQIERHEPVFFVVFRDIWRGGYDKDVTEVVDKSENEEENEEKDFKASVRELH